ncbi:unnamed protein product, partial [Pylaiella littoralis]
NDEEEQQQQRIATNGHCTIFTDQTAGGDLETGTLLRFAPNSRGVGLRSTRRTKQEYSRRYRLLLIERSKRAKKQKNEGRTFVVRENNNASCHERGEGFLRKKILNHGDMANRRNMHFIDDGDEHPAPRNCRKSAAMEQQGPGPHLLSSSKRAKRTVWISSGFGYQQPAAVAAAAAGAGAAVAGAAGAGAPVGGKRSGDDDDGGNRPVGGGGSGGGFGGGSEQP